MYGFYLLRGELQIAHRMAKRMLNIAQRTQDPLHLIDAHVNMGVALSHLGEFGLALEHLEIGFSFYEPEQHRFHIYGRHSGVHCLYHMATTSVALGYPDKALGRINEALDLARDLSHPYTLAMALNYAAYIHQVRRESVQAQERAGEQIALCAEHNIPHFLAMGTVFHGWSLAKQGKMEEGIAQMQQGLAAWRATGSELARSHLFALLAEAIGKAGEIREAIAIAVENLSMVDRTCDRYYEAELYRLKGELMLIQEAEETEAESCFHKSISVAQSQEARFFELKATASLCRLWQKQGKIEEAREMLQEIYDWFTEGFNTKDLQEAKALLEELSSG